jgi:G8 domain
LRNNRGRLLFETLESRSLLASLFSGFETALRPELNLAEPSSVESIELRAEGEDDRFVGVESDPYLPNFGHVANAGSRPIVESTANGVWEASVPAVNASSIVLVKHRVVIQSNVLVHTIVVQPGGSLTFSRTQNSSLRVVTLQVLEGGLLDLGTKASPIANVRAEISFRDLPVNTANDPAQYGNGLLVHGKVTMHGRELANTFVESQSEILQGQQTLAVEGNLGGWVAGDKLLVPDTSQMPYDYCVCWQSKYEIGELASNTTNSLMLASAARFDHLGARNTEGQLVFSPHVANLTRSVLLRSENPTGTRGHVMLLDGADAEIQYVEFKDLGRTTNAALDSTVFDAGGNVVDIGTNQVGRYPLHIHHVHGPETPQSSGKQFTIVGNSIYSTGRAVKWGITIHNSHYGLISHNVLYNIDGAGIATEDGSESFNVISNNFISRIGGTGDRGKFTDGREGSGIWLRRPNNYVDNNVVTGALKAAYLLFGGDNTAPPPVRIPAFQGAHADPEFLYVPAETMTLRSFSGNVAYASYVGLELWYMGFNNYTDPTKLPLSETVISDLGLWHNFSMPIFGIQVNSFRFENTKIYGDPSQFGAYNFHTGVVIHDAISVTFNNLVVENYRTGIESPLRVAKLDPSLALADVDPFTINGGRLANQQNVVITNPAEEGFVSFAPRSILIKNVDFAADSRGVSSSNIEMKYFAGRFTNLAQKDVVQVVNYDNTGKDYRLYYSQQAPDFIVPQTGSLSFAGPGSPLAAPVAGLTNRQAWERYGISIGGEVAPGDASHPLAIKVAGIRGLVFPGALSSTVLKAILTDTGNTRDFITSAQRLELLGEGRPAGTVAVTWAGQRIGTAVVDANGQWRYDFRRQLLASGEHVFGVQELNSSGVAVGNVSNRIVTIRPNVAQLQATVYPVYNDAVGGELAAKVTITDRDAGDSHALALSQQNQFVINSAGEIRVVNSARLMAGTSYNLLVSAADSAGLVATKNVTVLVTKRPAGDWVTRLNYTEFGQLTAEDVPYLTAQQIASIPNIYWFSRMSSSARAALSATQVQQLTNLQSVGTVTLLTPPQIAELTLAQVQSLGFQDFGFLPVSQISNLSALQIASISDAYWLRQIPAGVRAALTAGQVVHLRYNQGMIALLTLNQRQSLTPSQVRTITFVDFEFLPASQVGHLSSGQVASIPNPYWLERMGSTTRAALTSVQIAALNIGPSGMIALLTATQRSALIPFQIQTLTYVDFEYLPATQMQHLNRLQIASIETYWMSRIPAASRLGFTPTQIQQINLESVGIIALLTLPQRAMLTDFQIQQLTYQDFRFLPNDLVVRLTDNQLLSIRHSYWFFQFSDEARAILLRNGVSWVDGIGVVIRR